jgi:hypothetical protein
MVVLVILRPASGRRITGDSEITAETLGQYEPSDEDVNAVRAAFGEAGFDVGPLVGVSFAATGPRALVERFFGTKVSTSSITGAHVVSDSGDLSRELPLGNIAVEVANRLEAATFEPPEEVSC